MREMLTACAIALAMLAGASTAGAQDRKTPTTMGGLLKQGYEIRAVTGDAATLTNPYGFLSNTRVVMQKGSSVYVCGGGGAAAPPLNDPNRQTVRLICEEVGFE